MSTFYFKILCHILNSKMKYKYSQNSITGLESSSYLFSLTMWLLTYYYKIRVSKTSSSITEQRGDKGKDLNLSSRWIFILKMKEELKNLNQELPHMRIKVGERLLPFKRSLPSVNEHLIRHNGNITKVTSGISIALTKDAPLWEALLKSWHILNYKNHS